MFDIAKTIDELTKAIKSENIFKNEPMCDHTSFKIGGRASVFITPSTEDEILYAVKYANENKIPYYVMGNGSNLLVCDEGFDGIIICIGKNFSQITTNGCKICAQAGASLAKLSAEAAKHSLAGLEFASGIPGTVGGAVVMNAGAYGGEIKDVAVKTKYIDKSLCIKTVEGDAHNFGYRKSCFTEGDIVLETVFELKEGDKKQITDTMLELNSRRKEKQPLELPSAGSTFKRPEGYFAGKLIEDAGLKGFKIGGAEVSTKHCGFVVNSDNASYADVVNLINHIKNTVKQKFGVELECEVKILK